MAADHRVPGRAYISAIECALPEHRITSEELGVRNPGWKMDQVVLRTGVQTRFWCDDGETALDLAERACSALTRRQGVDLQTVHTILFCTQSPDHPMPPNACLLQDRLGLSVDVAALDFNLACSGFIYGLSLAKAIVDSHQANNVLLVTAETYSKRMSMDDRGPATLFGDGAAATLVSAGFDGMSEFMLATDGGRSNRFWVEAGGTRRRSCAATRARVADERGNLRSGEDLLMNGPAVFDFVRVEIPKFTRRVLQRARLSWDDVDLVLFHQASKLVLDYLYKTLKVPEAKRYTNIARVGNTVSASIPILLRDAEKEGVLRAGMRVLLVGFGVGMSWGGCVLTWR